MKKLFAFIWRFKFLFLIGAIILGVGGYFGWQKFFPKSVATRYVTTKATRGDLIVSISGSGQVYAATELDIKPKVSGDIASVSVKNGQEAQAGDLIAKIDGTDAQKAVRDAQTALETAKLDLQELLAPADALSLLQAQGAVTSAQNNLDSLLDPPDELELLKAENSLTSAKNSLVKLKITQADELQSAASAVQKAKDNLEKSYEDSFNTITNAFLDIPTVMTAIDNILHGYDIAKSDASVSYSSNVSVLQNTIPYSDGDNRNKFDDLAAAAESAYQAAKTAYDENFEDYKNASRYSDKAVIEALLDETAETVKMAAETVKGENNLLDFWVDYRTERDLRVFAKVSSYQSDLKTYTSKTSSHSSSLLSDQNNLENYKEARSDAERDLQEMNRNQPIALAEAEKGLEEKEKSLAELKAGADQKEIDSARRSLEEKKLSLQKLQDGADELEIRAKKLTIQQKEDALDDARQTLADHSVYAPMDGIVTAVNVQKGDAVSSGTSIVSFITKQEIVKIAVNELDAVQVKAGQPVTLTFDAIDGLTLTGEVAEIDSVGTISQGVVSYNVKISFADPEDKIKPGLSVSAEITVESRTDALMVPAGAIQTARSGSFVQTLDNGQPKMQPVTVGLTNDIMTEITGGLEEGDAVVTQTVTSGGAAGTAGTGSGNQDGRNGNQDFRMLMPMNGGSSGGGSAMGGTMRN